MYTFANPYSFQNTMNTPWTNTTPYFGGNFCNNYGWNTPNFGWNQYSWNTPQFPGFQNFNWNVNGWNQYGWNAPVNFGWNWNNGQFPMSGFDGYNGVNNATPYFQNSQFPTPFNWTTNWNAAQNVSPFPGLYNFTNTFGQGVPFGTFPYAGSTFGNYPYSNFNSGFGINANNAYTPFSFGTTPWMNSFGTPWAYGMPYFGNFGWNTPIGWNQPKVDGDVTVGKKGDVHVQPNRVAPYPVGFGPFVPFGYPNGEFAKNCAPACAA